jgi:hydroxymethylpyrimidine/phosphomethylpyrimidine kinase
MTVMSIAGFDPSGGAGVLNDIKTFQALNVYGTAVITALTAQNVKRLDDIIPVNSEFIEKQIDTVLEEENILYVKTGMLYSSDIIKTVASKIKEYQLKIVVDPVMVAGSGGLLSKKDMVNSLKKYLLPLAKLTTPNIFEAEILSGLEIKDESDAVKAALKIGEYCNVVVTGGHLEGNDVFYDGHINVLRGELVESQNTHGSGCTYSAAATAYLYKSFNLEEALIKAGDFTRKSIRQGFNGTLNQFWKFKECTNIKNHDL